MFISVEISYFPLMDNYSFAVKDFLNLLDDVDFEVKFTETSTTFLGELDVIMDFLKSSFSVVMKKYPSVFDLKISNCCVKSN